MIPYYPDGRETPIGILERESPAIISHETRPYAYCIFHCRGANARQLFAKHARAATNSRTNHRPKFNAATYYNVLPAMHGRRSCRAFHSRHAENARLELAPAKVARSWVVHVQATGKHCILSLGRQLASGQRCEQTLQYTAKLYA